MKVALDAIRGELHLLPENAEDSEELSRIQQYLLHHREDLKISCLTSPGGTLKCITIPLVK
jgi:hypothetical protein